jgi:hypothetical protein
MAINYCNQEIKGTLTTTGTITSGGSIYVPDYLIHTGDADTKIGFNTDDNVEIRVGGNLQISASSSRAYLRYQGSNKLQTDSAGINVTGKITATGNIVLDDGSGASPNIQFQNEDDDSWYIYNDSNGKFQVQQSSTIRATFSSGDLELANDLKVSGGGITLLGTGRIQGIDTVSAGTDAASKTYVDNAVATGGSFLPLAGGTLTGDLTISKSTPKITFDNTAGGGLDPSLTATGTDFTISTTSITPLTIALDTGTASFSNHINLVDGKYLMWGGNSILSHSGAATTIGDNSSGSVITIASGNSTFAGNIYMTGAGHIGAADNFYVGGATAGTDHTYIGDSNRNVTIYNGATFTVASGTTSLGNSLTVSGAVTITEQIYHSGDSNTYFGFHNNDEWRVVTGGTERLEVSNSGIKLSSSGSTVNTILDEDNMSSDSATALATQQSIKAYVDASTTGVLTYQGTWNADTNSPTLSSGSGTPGYYYIVSVAGSTDLDGITDWAVGDWAVFSDQATDAWQKIDNTAVGNVSGSGVSSRVAYWNGTGSITSTAGFTFNGNLAIPGYLTITGNQLVSPSNFTIDVGGDITLDADGGDIWFKDAGTEIGLLANTSSNLVLMSRVSDKDIIFKGNDGGSTITALTLDMSDAGTAIFNHHVSIPDYITHYNDASTRFGFSGASTFVVNTGGTTALTINSSQAATFTGDLQAPGIYVGATNTSYDFYNNGTSYFNGAVTVDAAFTTSGGAASSFSGDLTVGDELTITTIGNATADPDKFLCASGGNKVGYRTGAQVLSDIGAAPATGGAYLPLAGGTMTGDLQLQDNVRIDIGNSSDLQLWHNGTNSYVFNYNTGALNIGNSVTDGNTNFLGDDGSGGEETYFRVDGGDENVQFSHDILLYDNVSLLIGTGGDLQMYHNGSTSYIRNNTGTLEIRNQTSGASDVYFKTTTSSPSLDTFIILDGSAEQTQFTKNTEHQDGVKALFGAGSDMEVFHNGSQAYIENYTGELNFTQHVNNGYMRFKCDDGSGGTATYMFLDGSNERVTFNKDIRIIDSEKLQLGTSGDLNIYHDATNSNIVNETGDLLIEQKANDGDIKFYSDDGSGNVAQYFRLDGGSVTTQFLKTVKLYDNVALWLGDNNDLQIYHDGTHSFISDQGTGNLTLLTSQLIVNNAADSANMIVATQSGSVNLYYNGTQHFRTVSAGVEVTGKQTISTINEVSSDTDKFLMSDSGEIKYVTGANLKSYIGAGAGTVTSVSVGTGLDISNSTTTPNITMDLTELTLGAGIDSTATGLSLDFSEFGTATTDEVTSFIVYNAGDSQEERLLLADVHDIDAYWKYTPVVFNGAFNDGTSSTSTFYIPIAGSTSETTSSQEYQFAAMPFAGRIRTLMMQNTGTTPTTTNSTRMKIYKNGSLAYTTSYQVPTNGGSVGAYILFDNNTTYTFAAGDRIQFAYNKQFTSDYWRDVSFTAVVEFQQM